MDVDDDFLSQAFKLKTPAKATKDLLGWFKKHVPEPIACKVQCNTPELKRMFPTDCQSECVAMIRELRASKNK